MFGVKQNILGMVCLTLSAATYSGVQIKILTYPVAPFASQVKGVKQGFLIELVDALFIQANMTYQVYFYPLKRAMAMTEQNQNMCVLPVQRSQERESQFSWISPVMISRYGLFSSVHKKRPLQVLSDAKKLTIGSFLGSGISEYLKGFNYTIEYTSNNSLSFKQLDRGYIDLWAAELISAKSVMKNANLELGDPELIFYTSMGAMACHPSMPKAQQKALQLALKELYQNGFIDNLNAKYGVHLN